MEFDSYHWGRNLPAQHFASEGAVGARITAAIGAAAWRASVDEKAAVIVACTNTGATARAIDNRCFHGQRDRGGHPLFRNGPAAHY